MTVWTRVRPFVPWVLGLLGAVALFLGWFGVSGTPITAKQIPYVVSGGLVGVALVVLAAAFFATDDIKRQLRRVGDLERKVDTLYSLLVDELGPEAAETAVSRSSSGGRARSAALLALPQGTSFHAEGCALVVGKDEAKKVTPSQIASRSLSPCRICEPVAG